MKALVLFMLVAVIGLCILCLTRGNEQKSSFLRERRTSRSALDLALLRMRRDDTQECDDVEDGTPCTVPSVCTSDEDVSEEDADEQLTCTCVSADGGSAGTYSCE